MTDYRSLIDRAKGKRDTLVKQHSEAVSALALKQKRQRAIDFAQAIIQQTAQKTQESIRIHLEDIVQKCLDTVFPDEYTFKMGFDIARGKTEIKLRFFAGDDETDLLEAEGGGLVDIAALGLRIAAWTLSGSRNVMIFDESLKFLSRDLQARGAEVISSLATSLNLQFIFASHVAEIIAIADRTIEVSLVKEKIEGVNRRVSTVTLD